MKGLIIKKHWLDKILSGEKIWEMRSMNTNIRGHILLIQSGSGKILGEAHLHNCIEVDTTDKELKKYHCIGDEELLRKYSYAWVLTNVVKFEKPIPYKHPQGAVIWVKIDNEVTLCQH